LVTAANAKFLHAKRQRRVGARDAIMMDSSNSVVTDHGNHHG
jgi:hypothetical protein